jgi:hypothetical protein
MKAANSWFSSRTRRHPRAHSVQRRPTRGGPPQVSNEQSPMGSWRQAARQRRVSRSEKVMVETFASIRNGIWGTSI